MATSSAKIDFVQLALLSVCVALLFWAVTGAMQNLGVTNLNGIASISVIAAAVATVIIAGINLMSARTAVKAIETNRAVNEANTVRQFLDEYSSPEMYSALRTVSEWYSDADRPALVAATLELSTTELALAHSRPTTRCITYEEEDEVYQARRIIHYYFKKAHSLAKNGFISEEAVCSICDVQAKDLLFTAVRYLSLCAHPELNKKNPDVVRIHQDFTWFDDLKHMVRYQ